MLCSYLPLVGSDLRQQHASDLLSGQALQWRHNHRRHDCFLKRLFRHRSKKTSKPGVTGFCAGNSQVPDEFPSQRASNVGNVSIWRRHHGDVRIAPPITDLRYDVTNLFCIECIYDKISWKSLRYRATWLTCLHCNASLFTDGNFDITQPVGKALKAWETPTGTSNTMASKCTEND